MRTWPEDWEQRLTGDACPMCREGRPDDNGWGLRFHAGTCSDAYLQRQPLSPGYTILIWRGDRHVTELFDLTAAGLSAYMAEVSLVARALDERYRPAKINYQVLGNAEPHVHTHVVPRYLDDRAPEHPLPPPDDLTPVPDEHLRAEVAVLRSIIREIDKAR